METHHGKRCEQPEQCEVGDWITAESKPAWDPLYRTRNLAADDTCAITFRIEPYIAGIRVVVWLRVA